MIKELLNLRWLRSSNFVISWSGLRSYNFSTLRWLSMITLNNSWNLFSFLLIHLFGVIFIPRSFFSLFVLFLFFLLFLFVPISSQLVFINDTCTAFVFKVFLPDHKNVRVQYNNEQEVHGNQDSREISKTRDRHYIWESCSNEGSSSSWTSGQHSFRGSSEGISHSLVVVTLHLLVLVWLIPCIHEHKHVICSYSQHDKYCQNVQLWKIVDLENEFVQC